MALPADNKRSGGLKDRIIAAVVLAPPVLAAFYFGSPWFEFLIALGAGILAWEWSRICSAEKRMSAPDFIAIAIAACAIITGSFDRYDIAFALTLAGAVAVYVLVSWKGGKSAIWRSFGVLYAAIPCLALLWLRLDLSSGREIVLWILIVVWATDIGAYAFGKTIGGPKLLPAISPKKTWAGLIGGMVCAGLAGGGVIWMLGGAAVLGGSALSAMMAVVSQGGDFFESAVKRRFGVKDASNLIPGHGGLMDRVDGLLSVAVVFALMMISGLDGGFLWPS